MKIQWDEKAPEKIERRYTRLRESSKSQKSITFPRFTASTTVSETSFHEFAVAIKDVVHVVVYGLCCCWKSQSTVSVAK